MYELIRLIPLLGDEASENFVWTALSLAPCQAELRDHIYLILDGTIEKRFEKRYHSIIMLHNAEPKWVLHEEPESLAFLDQELIILENALRSLRDSCGHLQSSFTQCTRKLLEYGYGYSNKGTHERLLICDVV